MGGLRCCVCSLTFSTVSSFSCVEVYLEEVSLIVAVMDCNGKRRIAKKKKEEDNNVTLGLKN
jgi:ubiquitin C-terminal hydrolase